MTSYPIPQNEAERLAELHDYGVMDTPPEAQFDDLVMLASEICKTPIALVTLIDEERQWYKAKRGLLGQETPRSEAFCAHTIMHAGEVLIVEDAYEDPRFAENPAVLGDPFIRFYAGAPITTPAGHALGSVCVIDREPRRLTTAQQEALRALARQAQAQLELKRASRELLEKNRALRQELADREERVIGAARLAAIIESSEDAILSMNLGGVIQSWNPGAARLYGYTAEEMLGRRIHVVVPPDRHAELERMLERLGRKERLSHVETVRLRKDGSSFTAAISAAPILDDAGNVHSISWLVRDITRQKAAEREMAEALELQQAANRALQHTNEIKSSFVSVVGHEFRTPLTVIQGFAELLATERFDDEEVRDYARDIHEEAKRLTRLITDMLDLDRMESGHMSLTLAELDLNGLVSEVAARSVAHSPVHRLELRLAPELPPLRGDADRLRQVMTNLISNAIKYSPDGGTIMVSTVRAGAWSHVMIRDEGLGIEAEALERIFDRFVRAGTRRDRQIDGTGLGLPISRQIVELHGGRLWAESTPGSGSVFHVALPQAPPPCEEGA
jgi:PAS domain S-box-containing protein